VVNTKTEKNDYLLYYANRTFKVSKKSIPSNDNVELKREDYIIDINNKQLNVYYKTYNDLEQWGNLKLQVKAIHAANGKSIDALILNNTLYALTLDDNGIDLVEIGLDNKKDAIVAHEINTEKYNGIFVIPKTGQFIAYDDNAIYSGKVFGSKDDINSVNLSVEDIAIDDNNIYVLTNEGNDYNIKKYNFQLQKSDKEAKIENATVTNIAYVNNSLAAIATNDNKVLIKIFNPDTLEALNKDWVEVTTFTSVEPNIEVSTGNKAVYINVDGTLHIVDASNPQTPQVLNATVSNVEDFTVSGNLAYALNATAVNNGNLEVEKFTLNGATPTYVNTVDLDNYTTLNVKNAYLYAYGNYVFVNDNNNRVELYYLGDVTSNSTKVGYMGDADAPNGINSFVVKQINGTYYLITADGNYVHAIKLNPKEVK
jgi:hypothetical protein